MYAEQAAAAEVNLQAFIERRGRNLYTDSRAVALLFGKRHDNVLRIIGASLRKRNPVIAKFSRLNFEEAEFIDAQGKPRLMYRMTAKGMAELTMGFTGEKAEELRIRFVDAFDEVLSRASREGQALWDEAHAARLDMRASEEKGRIGSRLMLERKREKPSVNEKFDTLMAALQLKLFPE